MVFSPTKANGCTKCEQNQLNIIPSLNNIMTSLVCTSTSLIVNVRVNDVPIGSAYRMCLSGSGSFRHKLVLWRNHGTSCYYHSISFHILPQNLIQMQFSDLVVWIEHPPSHNSQIAPHLRPSLLTALCVQTLTIGHMIMECAVLQECRDIY